MTITATSDNQIRKSNIRDWTIGLQIRHRLPTAERFSATDVTEYLAGVRGSLRLDVGRPDHLGPFLGFVGVELTEIGGREREHVATEIGNPRLHIGVGKASHAILILRGLALA